MKQLSDRVEAFFAAFGRWIFQNAIKTILVILLVTIGFASQLPNLVIDTRNEAFFLQHDDTLLQYNAFREQFGKDESFALVIQPPDIFSTVFLEKLQRFHNKLAENVPYVDDINSLISARHTYGKKDELIVGELLETIPQTAAEIEILKQQVLSNPLYVNQLISKDAKFTTVLVKPFVYVPEPEVDVLAAFDESPTSNIELKQAYLSNDQYLEMNTAVEQIVAEFQADDFKVYITGLPAILSNLDEGIRHAMATLIPISYALIIGFLFFMFRRFSGVIYPVIIVSLSTLVTMSLIPICDATLNHITKIIPTFIMVVGIADAVHILAIFYRHYEQNGDKEAAIVFALGHSSLAILMTSLTTAVGLFSFSLADVAPVSQFGLITPLGVLLVFVYTVVLLPALIAVFPLGKPTKQSGRHSQRLDDYLGKVAHFSCHHPYKILFFSALLIAVSAVGVSKLELVHNPLKWFPDDAPILEATKVIDDNMGGSATLEVVIDTGKPNGLYDPVLLKQLSESVKFIETLEMDEIYVGKAWSLDSIVKEINQALNENKAEAYRIPDDRLLIAQELFLFESSGSDDLEKFVDTELSKVRFTLKTPFGNAYHYQPMVDTVTQHFITHYPHSKVTVTGGTSLSVKMVLNVISSMIKSYTLSLILITALMIVLIGQIRLGIISMVPNLVPLFIVAGLMGWSGVPLDFVTMLTGSIAISLVVDDTIHFMHNFRRYFEQSGDVEYAVRETLLTAGRAILITSVVLAVSFFSYILVEMKSTVYFGLISGGAVVLALLSDYFLTPALLTIVLRRQVQKYPLPASAKA